MKLSELQRAPIMCLTQDGLRFGHREQTRRLCAAGAKWIQLRMKIGAAAEWRATAAEAVRICRDHGAICIVNDHVEIAIEARADGVHLGKDDLDWREARRRLGEGMIVGGTVNFSSDVERTKSCGVVDYVGVGPWRFTANKKQLAPILGAAGAQPLIAALAEIPAWVIGGIEADDAAAVRATGAAGLAVSSALFRGGDIERNFAALARAWAQARSAEAPQALKI